MSDFLTPISIKAWLQQMDYERDARRHPDSRRGGQFRAGWLDATKGKKYASATLKRLTWHNLGYRMAQHYGDLPLDQVQRAFDYLSDFYVSTCQVQAMNNLNILPEEVLPTVTFIEGAMRTIIINAYERNPEARQKCIEYYGAKCSVCDFDFEAKYGEAARGYVHVHHLRPLAEIGNEHIVDPIRDLRPVCPNCHAVIHMRNPAYGIAEVQEFLHQSNERFKEERHP